MAQIEAGLFCDFGREIAPRLHGELRVPLMLLGCIGVIFGCVRAGLLPLWLAGGLWVAWGVNLRSGLFCAAEASTWKE